MSTDIINKIKGKGILAPMLATTDIPFRTLCKNEGAALTFTEMVSAVGILRAASTSYRNAVFTPDEHPIGIQLVAAEPDSAAAAIRELLPFKPDLFDINCGCPNDRICEAGAGAELLDDLPRFTQILRAASDASPVPVSVKVRMRGNDTRQTVRDIVRAAEDGGVALITIHARTRNTPYDEAARWEFIADAVNTVSTPIVGNGDIFSSADAFRMLRETGCTAVMVARGCLGTPWIFRDIDSGHDSGIDEHAPEAAAMLAMTVSHLESMLREFGAFRALPRMRKHALWFARRFHGAADLRSQLFAKDDPAALIDAVRNFFADDRHRLATDDPLLIATERRFRERVLYWTTGIVQPEG
ncbi:MAG: tRNA-dihydrouridine synthase [Bacteroidetes bacterium]|nr:tRNA-dihydrouridine synthase [Bacteroidota bacterium]